VITPLILLLLSAAPPQSPGQADYNRANALFTQQKVEDSWQAVERALAADPSLVPALTLKAKLALAVNRYDVARTTLERAIQVDPSSSYAHFLYGFHFHIQNEMRAAVAPLQSAIRLDPRDPRPVRYLGLTQESLGLNVEALALYRKAIQLEEAARKLQPESLLTAARLLLLLDRLDECRTLIERAVKLDPRSRDARFELARLLLRQGDAPAAIRHAEAALLLPLPGAEDEKLHYLLVRAYQSAGDPTNAYRHAAAIRNRPAP
jgi:tetratricopeptide (TPR) repeat protein